MTTINETAVRVSRGPAIVVWVALLTTLTALACITEFFGLRHEATELFDGVRVVVAALGRTIEVGEFAPRLPGPVSLALFGAVAVAGHLFARSWHDRWRPC